VKNRLLKISKYLAISVLSLVLLLSITIGIVFQFVLTPEKITPKVLSAINENLNSEMYIEAIELTFFKTFPSFKLELKNGFLKGVPISKDSTFNRNDTLMKFDYGVVSVNPLAFIANNIQVNKLSFENPEIYARVSSDGKPNWDVLKEREPEVDPPAETDEEQKDFNASINIEEISIIDGNLIFDDHYSGNFVSIEGFDLNLAAKYNDKEVLLKVISESDNVLLRKNRDTYTDQLAIALNTDFHVNRKSKVIDIKNAKVGINDISFVTEGTLHPDRDKKQIEVNLKLDLEVPTLNTLIDLVPESVFEKSNDYEAKGDVSLLAVIKGTYKKAEIPAINAKFQIREGSISYQNKPNKIELLEADIEAYISPQITSGSHFDIHDFTLKGVGTEINITGKGRDLFDHAKLDIDANGRVDLGALENSFPFKKSLNLEGSAEVHLSSQFNISDIQKQDYGKIQALGTFKMDQVVFNSEADSLLIAIQKADIHLEQDQNSNLLTERSSKVIGGNINVRNLDFKNGKNSAGNLDQLNIEFATTPLQDSTKVAVMKSSILIKNGNINLGDTLVAQLKFIKAQVDLQPYAKDPSMPSIHSVFQIDSTGIRSKGRFFAITKGDYELRSARLNNEWPINGHISFDQLYAYTPEFPLLLKMPQTRVTFRPGIISLDHAKIEIGNSDVEATGKVFNMRSAFFDNKMFTGELQVTSALIDFNEIIQAINKGLDPVDKTPEQILVQEQSASDTETIEQPRSFVVPEKLDLSLKSRFNKLKYKKFIVDDVVGVITIKDQKIDLSNLQMTTMAAKMTTSAAYTSKEAGIAELDFDFKIFDIDLSKLTELLPVLDTLLPMVDSFEGKVDARMKGNTVVDKNLDMNAASIDAIARVAGTNLVVLNGKTFEKMAKMLLFKNKEKNTIDRLEFAMIFKDKQIEIFPSMVSVDRYKVAIGGHHNLDLTYDYHVSVLKSPMPFKAGIDLKGTEEDMDFKITKAKYKYLFSTKERQQKKADSTLIKRKINVINRLPF
jgi:hypothetical protein